MLKDKISANQLHCGYDLRAHQLRSGVVTAADIRLEPPETPTTEAVMRARAVLNMEIMRLREKAALWREQSSPHADLMDSDADELASVRSYLGPLDYPGSQGD